MTLWTPPFDDGPDIIGACYYYLAWFDMISVEIDSITKIVSVECRPEIEALVDHAQGENELLLDKTLWFLSDRGVYFSDISIDKIYNATVPMLRPHERRDPSPHHFIIRGVALKHNAYTHPHYQTVPMMSS